MRRTLSPLAALPVLAALAATSATRPAVGQTSGPEFSASLSVAGSQGQPDAAVGPTRFVIVWHGDGMTAQGARNGIFARRFTRPGVALSEEQMDDDTATVASPRVAAGSDFFVVWEQAVAGASTDIFGRGYSAASGPSGAAFRVNSSTTALQQRVDVDGDDVAGYVVVWESPDGEGTGVYGQRYTPGLTPIGGEFRVNAVTTGSQILPAVTLLAAGSFVVAWQGPSILGTTGSNVYFQRFDSSGAPLGVETRPHAVVTGDQESPGLASDPLGAFVVVWTDDDGHQGGVYGRRYTSGGVPMAEEFRVNASTTGLQSKASVAMSGLGLVVSWHQDVSDGNLFDVFARRFDSAGVVAGVGFRVNTYTTSYQWVPRIAASADGREYVVAWESQGQDDSLGAYARKLCLGGDANNNGVVDVADVFYLINSLFAGGAEPYGCADANGSLTVDVADVFHLINFLFAGGAPPA